MGNDNKLACPACQAPVKPVRGLRVGGKITCSRCAASFIARPGDVERLSGISAPVGCASSSFAALAFLGGGAAAALRCFAEAGPGAGVE